MDFKYDQGLAKGREDKEAVLEKERKEKNCCKKAKQEERLEVAKTLLLQSVDIETIAKVTKLSKEKIKTLLP